MEAQILYAKHYTDPDNNDHYLSVYDGIYQPNTPLNSKTWSTVRFLGNINLTQRYFLKGAKFQTKVTNIENNIITITGNNQLRPFQELLVELGNQQDFIDTVQNAIFTNSNEKKQRTYNTYKTILHRTNLLQEANDPEFIEMLNKYGKCFF
jgi:hypothetical protein